ncbi:glycerophosphodiester phosphodiesterase family protein [Nocardioides sp. Kera G14]|uniref:glycerophosphodiester phosphodiesterase family protein n=1 Tax=Nocardioides sp. Kera G14 TaxID=2884264 RepID=UPI001D108552|nr:glycerophosphodiester phosphodiesterase family protein [Nocardioides sp. Kera G14]UDY24360.1 glycerophosphodiester phosphodiesterase [Nocardioides sp. Kera G14]
MTSRGLGLVIGHRGAPSHLPENTLPSFRRACRLGADSLETDLQMSRDGVLVLIHDTELSRTTDIALHGEFASRRSSRVIDRELVEGWFVDDFTLAELRTLNTADTRIPTFDELLLLLAEESQRAGRRIGLHAEVKHPSYFAAAGLPMARPVLETLRDHGLDRRGKRVWIQSFDEQFLRALSPMTELPLVQLLETDQPFTCASVASYADAIGPDRQLVLSSDRFETGLVAEAHRAGLVVFVWTLRGDARQARRFLDAGVDGVFSDDAAVALAARDLLTPA